MRLFQWDCAINYNQNEAENEKRINYLRHKTRLEHGHNYSKYKVFLSMIMAMWNKQHLSNIWSWIHGKVKQHWGWVQTKCGLLKKCVKLTIQTFYFFPIWSNKYRIESYIWYTLIEKKTVHLWEHLTVMIKTLV